jgi:hypothetical protein
MMAHAAIGQRMKLFSKRETGVQGAVKVFEPLELQRLRVVAMKRAWTAAIQRRARTGWAFLACLNQCFLGRPVF